MKSKEKKGKVYPTECRVPENSKERQEGLLQQCEETEEKNRRGRTRGLFKNIADTKGKFHAKIGTITDRKVKEDLTKDNFKMGIAIGERGGVQL